jgi:hypothetical protein
MIKYQMFIFWIHATAVNIDKQILYIYSLLFLFSKWNQFASCKEKGISMLVLVLFLYTCGIVINMLLFYQYFSLSKELCTGVMKLVMYTK